MTQSAEGYTNRLVYFLCISDFYLFVSHLIEGANASKFIHASANLGMLHSKGPLSAGGFVAVEIPLHFR